MVRREATTQQQPTRVAKSIFTRCELFTARSISEEFSSGDSRYRDNDEPAQQGAHSRDPQKAQKEKDEKEKGDEGKMHFHSLLIQFFNTFIFAASKGEFPLRPRVVFQ